MFVLVKVKNNPMKTTSFFLLLASILIISSCTTVYYTQSYEDANYLNPDEFTDSEIQKLNDENVTYSDTSEDGTMINNYYGDYYEADDYYDFSYSARIRRC